MKLLVKEWDKQIQTLGCTSSFLPSRWLSCAVRRHGSTNTQRWLVAHDGSRSFSRKKRRETTGREIWWPRFFFGELKGRWEHLRNFGRYSEHFPWLFIGVLEWDFASLLVWNPLAGTMIFEYVCLKDRADRSNQTSWWCGFERIQIWRTNSVFLPNNILWLHSILIWKKAIIALLWTVFKELLWRARSPSRV